MEKIVAIISLTFLEAKRAKVVYLVFAFLILMVSLSSLFGSVTIGDQLTVVKDLGLCAVSLCSVLYTIVVGATFIHNELNNKTIYNILSRSVSRGEFIVGKFLGITAVSSSIMISTFIVLFGYVSIIQSGFDFNLLYVAYFFLCEVIVLSGLVIFFSSLVVTPILCGMFSFLFFLSGRTASYIFDFANSSDSLVLTIIYWILPHLHYFQVSDNVVSGQMPSFGHMSSALIYSLGYTGVVVSLSIILFNKREFS